MIAIIDYGSGNIQAIKNVYDKLKIDCRFASLPEHLENVEKIILPGVGAFDEAMKQLNQSGMLETLNKLVLEKRIPVLGVCVGMQIMATKSDEGGYAGLGWFNSNIKKFDSGKINHKPKFPHMGWNSILPTKNHFIFKNVDIEKGFYFLHSYYFDCKDNSEILATTNYGENFTCAINKDNIFGFQFHPEKSHSNGINIFKNFAEIDYA